MAEARQDAAGDNRRRAVRKPTRNLGYISASGQDERECVLIDISQSGAQLRLVGVEAKPFQAPLAIPATFVLKISADHSEIDCETTWRRGTVLGVRFLSAFRRRASKR